MLAGERSAIDAVIARLTVRLLSQLVCQLRAKVRRPRSFEHTTINGVEASKVTSEITRITQKDQSYAVEPLKYAIKTYESEEPVVSSRTNSSSL